VAGLRKEKADNGIENGLRPDFKRDAAERLGAVASRGPVYRQAWSPGVMRPVARDSRAICHRMWQRTAVGEASRARAPDSPMPGEHTDV
jgi:hypothetical protein